MTDAVWADDLSSGGGRLTVPIRPRPGLLGRLFPFPQSATKTYEFDLLGRFVWEACDGTVTVLQLARSLSDRLGISQREATVCVELFLATLARKGLIGITGAGHDARSSPP